MDHKKLATLAHMISTIFTCSKADASQWIIIFLITVARKIGNIFTCGKAKQVNGYFF